jgi:subtilisin family serine protease
MKKTTLFLFLVSNFLYSHLFAQIQNNDYFDGQIYFKFKDSYPLPSRVLSDKVNIADFSFLNEMKDIYGISQLRASFYFAKQENLKRTFRLYFDRTDRINEFLDLLNNNPNVEYAERVPIHRKTVVPNDLGANNTGSTGQWFLHKIRAQQAWDLTLGNSAIKVAVVDDAVQTTHPDLTNVCLAGRDVASNDNDPNPPDATFDHGTHVAGIVGAQTNNGLGIASIGFGISIIPIKATNEVEFITDGYEGVTWAINNGADVINMSWGGSGGSQTGQNIMNAGNTAGVVLVAAAGNDDVSSTFFPAGFNFVISVASTSSSDAKSSFSNYGTWIDISAPGSSIRSTIPGTGYALKSGTSMASPLVAGLCGLMLSANPILTPADVLSCLQESADNINSQNSAYIGELGGGRINAEASIICASASAVAFDASVTNIISPVSSSCESSFVPEINFRNNGQSSITNLQFTIQLDSNSPVLFNWTGNLSSQQSLNLILPEMSASIGNHTLSICSSIINNNQPDGFSSNNCKTKLFTIVSPIGSSLPFIETFESGNFSTNGWSIVNPDNSLTWEIITTQGTTPGSKSARIPFFSYPTTGARDGLVSPTFNLSSYSTVTLSFDHAYRRYEAGVSDSLIVSISTDCGATYPSRVYIGGESGIGTFATAGISTADFIPVNSDTWCDGPVGADCVNLDLTAFTGSTGVRIKFEGYNNYGNNLYLDNINITGTISGAPAIADFSIQGDNTICSGEQVLFTNLSGNLPTGFLWVFQGGSPSTSTLTNPSVTYTQPGTYTVTLAATNSVGEDTEVKTDFITVEPIPAIGVSSSQLEVCKGTPVTLTAFGAASYEWSPIIAISSTTGTSIQASPPSTTTYTVEGLSLAGCSASANITITVNDLPAVPQINIVTGGLLQATTSTGYQWFFNGIAIPGAIFQTLLPAETGEYQVEVENENGCKRRSQILFQNLTSIDDSNIFSSTYVISPNPAKDMINILNIPYQIEKISIYSLAGQLMSQINLDDKSIKISNFASGIYFLSILHKNGIAIRKLIIEN